MEIVAGESLQADPASVSIRRPIFPLRQHLCPGQQPLWILTDPYSISRYTSKYQEQVSKSFLVTFFFLSWIVLWNANHWIKCRNASIWTVWLWHGGNLHSMVTPFFCWCILDCNYYYLLGGIKHKCVANWDHHILADWMSRPERCFWLISLFVNNPLPLLFISWLLHIIQTVLHMLQVSLAYMLMLCVMSYNTWIFLGVITGSVLGYFISFPLLGRMWWHRHLIVK